MSEDALFPDILVIIPMGLIAFFWLCWAKNVIEKVASVIFGVDCPYPWGELAFAGFWANFLPMGILYGYWAGDVHWPF